MNHNDKSNGTGITYIGIQRVQKFLEENGFKLPIVEIAGFNHLTPKECFTELIECKGIPVFIKDAIYEYGPLAKTPAARLRDGNDFWICFDGVSIIISKEKTRMTRLLNNFMLREEQNFQKLLNIARYGVDDLSEHEKTVFYSHPDVYINTILKK